MNETYVTLVGNIASDLKHDQTPSGLPVTTFRLASTTRRFDRGRGGWADLDTIYVTVTCFRQLAENVASSCAKGEPVVVTGRLKMRQWSTPDGRSGTVMELDANSVGHDLGRGTSAFKKSPSRPPAPRPETSVADELALAVAMEPLPTSPAEYDATAEGGAAA